MRRTLVDLLDWDAFDNALASFPMLRNFDLVFREDSDMKEVLEEHTVESKLPVLHSKLLAQKGGFQCRLDRVPTWKFSWYRETLGTE